ncbi:hypothetical protein [Massilia sp. X63]|jgi:hypothetical protein|uniref:hypothetical protein n=1 Tax=Massilia sp. X63 TaxID=3237285 RepID=UPI0034DD3ABC
MRLSPRHEGEKFLPVGKILINNSQQGNTGTDTPRAKPTNRTGKRTCTVSTRDWSGGDGRSCFNRGHSF